MLPKKTQIIYGIGAQKGGTSWLFDQLKMSADVHGSTVKEMHYFDTLHMPTDQNHSTQRLATLNALVAKVKGGFQPENANRLRQIQKVIRQLECFAVEAGDHSAYIKALSHGRKQQANLLDVTPSYCGLPVNGFKDMASIGPSKFIFILRDPVSRMWSQIRMRTTMLKSAKDDEDFRRISVEHANHLRDINRYPNIFRANYLRTMDRLEQAVPAEDIKYVFHENLFEQTTMDDLCAFLKIAPVQVDADNQVNLGRSIRIDAATRALIGTELRHQYDGVFEKFGDAVPQKWHDTLQKVDDFSVGSPLGVVRPTAEANNPVARGARKVRGLMSRLKPVDKTQLHRPVVFLHIPKTAGQTISKQVRLAIGSRNVSPVLTHSQASTEEHFPAGYRYYGGHLDWVAMEASLENCFSFSVLRDPKERIASLYFFLHREAQRLSKSDLQRPEHSGKQFLLDVSADDYFFPQGADMQSFVANGYYNKYCYYFASRRMRGWSARRKMDEREVLRTAREGIRDVSRIYALSQLNILEKDLSEVMQTRLSLTKSATNVGPTSPSGSRWNDLCALFEKDSSARKLEDFVSLDQEFIESLDFSDGPVVGKGGEQLG